MEGEVTPTHGELEEMPENTESTPIEDWETPSQNERVPAQGEGRATPEESPEKDTSSRQCKSANHVKQGNLSWGPRALFLL